MSRGRPRPSKLFWKLFLGYVVLTVGALGVCVYFVTHEFERLGDRSLEQNLLAHATALRNQVGDHLSKTTPNELRAIAQRASRSTDRAMRVSFLDPNGVIIADSQMGVLPGQTEAIREELEIARLDGIGITTRWSEATGTLQKHVAVRIGNQASPAGFVRTALSAGVIGAQSEANRRIVWTIAITAALATAIFALGLASLWTLPIRRISVIAGRISRGDLSARARVRGNDEIAELAQSLNEMRDHLSLQLTTIDHQRQTFESLLTQLQEGVIVAGPDGRIVLANPSAQRLVAPDTEASPHTLNWVGRPVEQCVPQHDFQRLLLPGRIVDETSGKKREPRPGDSTILDPDLLDSGFLDDVIENKNAAEDEQTNGSRRTARERGIDEVRVELRNGSDTVVVLATASDFMLPQATNMDGVPIRSERGRILALRDISEIARTVQVKTDFAANASHELRTPLSAIRGAVETLMSIDMTSDQDTASRFLSVVDRHSARLEAIVSDLLALSRLESAASTFKPSTVQTRYFSNEMHDKWRDSLADKSITWTCEIPEDLIEVELDPHLANLALSNLIDNAIKFSEPGGTILLRWEREADDVKIEVSDNGCGIPEKELARVFERFYQVTQARSGTDKRGTGLGLSIVRHATAAMNGKVRISSAIGKGTTVSIHIPQDH
ncbi:MAG: ATP-binding protein [Phycisphaerae bacterium]